MKKLITIIIVFLLITIVSYNLYQSSFNSNIRPYLKAVLNPVKKNDLYQTIDKGDFDLTYHALHSDKSYHIQVYGDGKAKHYRHPYINNNQYTIRYMIFDEKEIKELAKLAVSKNIFSMNDKMDTTDIIYDAGDTFIELRIGEHYIKAGGYCPTNKDFNDIEDAIYYFISENRPKFETIIDNPEKITIETFNRSLNKMDGSQIKGYLTFNTFEPSNTTRIDLSFVLDYLNTEYEHEHAKVVFEASEGVKIVGNNSYTFKNVSDQNERSIQIQLEGTSLYQYGEIKTQVTLFDDNGYEYDYLEMSVYFYITEDGVMLSESTPTWLIGSYHMYLSNNGELANNNYLQFNSINPIVYCSVNQGYYKLSHEISGVRYTDTNYIPSYNFQPLYEDSISRDNPMTISLNYTIDDPQICYVIIDVENTGPLGMKDSIRVDDNLAYTQSIDLKILDEFDKFAVGKLDLKLSAFDDSNQKLFDMTRRLYYVLDETSLALFDVSYDILSYLLSNKLIDKKMYPYQIYRIEKGMKPTI